MDYDSPSPKPARKDLSKTPSWVMVGFIAGGLTILGIQREFHLNEPPAPVSTPVIEASPPKSETSVAAVANRPSLSAIEATFVDWTRYVVWENDLTEVALWNPTTADYSDFLEVRRDGDTYFFRTIPHFTRIVVTQGVPSGSPFRFTETENERMKGGHN